MPIIFKCDTCGIEEIVTTKVCKKEHSMDLPVHYDLWFRSTYMPMPDKLIVACSKGCADVQDFEDDTEIETGHLS